MKSNRKQSADTVNSVSTQKVWQERSKMQKLGLELKNSRHLYAMIAPWFILFTAFTVFPVGFSMVMSFTNFNVLQSPTWVGIGNYRDLILNDPLFLTAFQNTFLLAIIIGPIGYILSFVMAWILNEFHRVLRTILTVVLYAPSLAGTAVSIWTLIFSSDSTGYLNALLIDWGIIAEPILWLQDANYMAMIIIIVNLWMSFGIGFLSFIAGLQGVDRSQLEAGEIDGIKSRWQELWYIILPSMRPQLMFGAVMTISGSLAITGSALTGFPSTGYATHTIIDHVTDYGLIRFELGYASAITVVLFLMMIFVNLLVQKFLKGVGQ